MFLARFCRFLLSTTLSRRRTVIVGCIEIDQNHVKVRQSAVAAAAVVAAVAAAAAAALSRTAPSFFLTHHNGLEIWLV